MSKEKIDFKYHIRTNNLDESLNSRIKQLQENSSAVSASRQIVKNALKTDEAHYGINTGFGALATTKIPYEQRRELQYNFIRSHAAGMGDYIPKEISRLMLGFKIHSLGIGYSGISEEVFERLLYFYVNDLIPQAPQKGSLGASGDLAPLSHMSLPLVGLGSFWDIDGKSSLPADQVLKEHKLELIELASKDGLALSNGTQMMCAYGSYTLSRALDLLKLADIAAALTFESLLAINDPLDARVHELRPHQGQITVAKNLRKLLQNSKHCVSKKATKKVQDPYSLRCSPQVHGASRDAINYCVAALDTELNSVTDNPLLFENQDVIGAGNFHGQPMALTFDFAAIALAELASISERRIYLLTKGLEGLPKLLVEKSGINSGFMIPQYTAAALVSENKVLCHPASVDSITSCLGQEDHVSMGSIASTKLYEIFRNVHDVLSIELLAARQALGFREESDLAPGTLAAYNCLAGEIKHRKSDDVFEPDFKNTSKLMSSGIIVNQVESIIGDLS